MPLRISSPVSSMIGAILLSERGNVRTVVAGSENKVKGIESTNHSTITNDEDPTAWGFWAGSVDRSQNINSQPKNSEVNRTIVSKNLISGIVPLDALTEQNLATIETPRSLTRVDFAKVAKTYQTN